MTQGTTGWPVELAGITETVIATQNEDGRWNLAALGIHAPSTDTTKATARTFGETTTHRNFEATRPDPPIVQFVSDPLVFVRAALKCWCVDTPLRGETHAWARVDVERIDAEEDGETTITTWGLTPLEAVTRDAPTPTINRGRNAAIEASVAVSRLDLPETDMRALEKRLDWLLEVARRCGDDRTHRAVEILESARRRRHP